MCVRVRVCVRVCVCVCTGTQSVTHLHTHLPTHSRNHSSTHALAHIAARSLVPSICLFLPLIQDAAFAEALRSKEESSRQRAEQERLREDILKFMQQMGPEADIITTKMKAKLEMDMAVTKHKFEVQQRQLVRDADTSRKQLEKVIEDLKSSNNTELKDSIRCMKLDQEKRENELKQAIEEAKSNARASAAYVAEAEKRVQLAHKGLEDSQVAMAKELLQKQQEYKDKLATSEMKQEELRVKIKEEQQKVADMNIALEEAKAKLEDMKVKQGSVENLKKAQREMEYVTKELQTVIRETETQTEARESEISKTEIIAKEYEAVGELIKTGIGGLHAHLSKQDRDLAAIRNTLQALAEGDNLIPSLFLVLSKETMDKLRTEKPKTWRGKAWKRVKKAALHDFFRDHFYIVFIDRVDMKPMELTTGEPGYILREAKQWVKDHACAIQTSLFLIKGVVFAAQCAGIQVGLPEDFVSGTEELLEAAGVVDDAAHALEIDIPTPPTPTEFEAAFNEAAEAESWGALTEAARTQFTNTANPALISEQIKGPYFRRVAQTVLEQDPSLTKFTGVKGVSPEGWIAWVKPENLDEWRTNATRLADLLKSTSEVPEEKDQTHESASMEQSNSTAVEPIYLSAGSAAEYEPLRKAMDDRFDDIKRELQIIKDMLGGDDGYEASAPRWAHKGRYQIVGVPAAKPQPTTQGQAPVLGPQRKASTGSNQQRRSFNDVAGIE